MAAYLILGAGKFGSLALKRLARQDAAATFLVVDRRPQALAAALALGIPRVAGTVAEAATFLAGNLAEDSPWDWLIPMVPVHLAWAWLLAGPLRGWEPAAPPDILGDLAPVAWRGLEGQWYLSRATHRCPDDCDEPESVCPVSREPRKAALSDELAAVSLPGFAIKVVADPATGSRSGGLPARGLAGPGPGPGRPGRPDLDCHRLPLPWGGARAERPSTCKPNQETENSKKSTMSGFDQSGVLGASPRMREIFHLLELVSASDANVLVLGETGTGKELVARAIHRNSPRAAAPFVVVNCAALPETLMESELFGHERGAFTGAVSRQEGRFLMAHRGSLFLDEIGELSLNIQAKLLRVLQTREFEPLGSTRTLKVDVRIIAATNRNLEARVREGRFRDDLFYRLNVFPIVLPPLKERLDDLPLLADHFLRTYAAKNRKNIKSISTEVLQAFQDYPWPGNIRELENVIERGVIVCRGDTLTLRDLPDHLLHAGKTAAEYLVEPALPELERQLISRTLEKVDGQRQAAAEILGISLEELEVRLRSYGVGK